MSIMQAFLCRVGDTRDNVREIYLIYGISECILQRELEKFSFDISNGLQI